MELTIFNTYIEVESQEQADRLKQICIDNNLPIWNNGIAFEVFPISRFFRFCMSTFYIGGSVRDFKVTESEWLELLEQHNKTK